MKRNLIRIFTIILVVSLILSIRYIIKNTNEDKEQKQIFEDLEDIATEKTKNKENEQEEKQNLKQLYELNNDFVGWLKIENTNVNYPVMQTDNKQKDYYLKRNFYKQYSQLGTPYIAEYCNIKKSDNIIIYGHHINNYKMFGELEKYKNQKFYDTHKIITFETVEEMSKYEIIAVFKTVAYTGFEYYKFEKANSNQEFDTFITKCKELSFYEIEKTAKYGDKLITLSTCEYSRKDGKLAVVAKKIIDE